MTNVDDKIKEYLLDKVKEQEQQLGELVTQNSLIRLSKDNELKREIKEAKKKVFQHIKTTIVDNSKRYWWYNIDGEPYMSVQILIDIFKNLEKNIEDDKNELWD